jgi:hypothetical protein
LGFLADANFSCKYHSIHAPMLILSETVSYKKLLSVQ